VDAVSFRHDSHASAQPVTWLSGEVVTFFNKIGPVIWLAATAGALSAVVLKTGRLFIAPAFRPLGVFFLLATVFIFWLSVRLHRVGHSGRDLIVSNYLRQVRIPFDQVEAVEPVWWYYRRMVRIRLRSSTSFGQVVYYIPKWAAFKCLWVAPDKELRELLATNSELPLPYPCE
jgi:hypothetical protein